MEDFCVAAASQTKTGIVQHNKANGHPDGIAVRHIGLNLKLADWQNTRPVIISVLVVYLLPVVWSIGLGSLPAELAAP